MCSVAQSCLALCDPMGCSPPCSSFRGIFQARRQGWVVISFSRGSFNQGPNPRLLCLLPCSGILYLLGCWEAFPVGVSMSKFLCFVRTPVFVLGPILITSSSKMTPEMSVCPNKVTFWETRTSACEFVGRGIQLNPKHGLCNLSYEGK